MGSFWARCRGRRMGPRADGLGAISGASGTAVDRSEAEAWSASDDGKDFMRRSSQQWGEASIKAGTPEAAARAAADRTTAFYCGEPEGGA